MSDSNMAAKAFVVDREGRLLIIRRRHGDSHKPGVWEVPGGRLGPGEDVVQGLKRETLEETGLSIKVLNPLGMREFTRDDGKQITLLIFRAVPEKGEIELSHEHIDYEWVSLDEAYRKIYPAFRPDIDVLRKTMYFFR